MRPREREQEQETPPPPPLSSPPRRIKGSLSSMVVRPSNSPGGGGGSDFESGEVRKADRWKQDEEAPAHPPRSRSRRLSVDSDCPPLKLMPYGGDALNAGNNARASSSSPRQPQKLNHHDPDFDRSGGQQHGRLSPRQRSLENHRYNTDHDQRGGVARDQGSPHQRRSPDRMRYHSEYDKHKLIHGHPSPPRQRPYIHQYELEFDRRRSPFPRMPDNGHYDSDLDRPEGPKHDRGFWGGRDGRRFRDLSPTYGRGDRGRFRGVSRPYGRGRGRGRFRDISPPYRHGRGTGRFRDVSPAYLHERSEKFFDEGLDGHEPGDLPSRGVHRNDPNLAPRVGDWICKDPSCGNLNFARREYCNNCHKLRYSSMDGSPRRSHSGPPSPPALPLPLPPRFFGAPVERGPFKDVNDYRSPPRGWARESPKGLPPHVPRDRPDHREEIGYRERGRFVREIPRERDHMDHQRDDFIHERREFDRRRPSPSNHWENDSRERSRSPMRKRGPQAYHRNSYAGRGWGGRWGMGRGRNDDAYH